MTTIIIPASESLSTTNTVTFSGTSKDPRLDDTGVAVVFLQVNADPPMSVTGTANWSGQILLPPGTNTVSAFALDIAGNAYHAITVESSWLKWNYETVPAIARRIYDAAQEPRTLALYPAKLSGPAVLNDASTAEVRGVFMDFLRASFTSLTLSV